MNRAKAMLDASEGWTKDWLIGDGPFSSYNNVALCAKKGGKAKKKAASAQRTQRSIHLRLLV